MVSKGQSGHKSVEVDPSQVRSTAFGAFERTHGHTQGAAVERKPNQPASFICGRPYALRSTINNRCVRTHDLHSNVAHDLSAYK
jgi:hypothetical protein